MKNKILKIFKNEYLIAFLLIYALGLIAFGICAAPNSFTLPMGGDYVLQTYAFYSQGYEIFWNFIKTGEYPLFDFSNYLGANYLGTQSFYYVFSPLFYLLCLWPKKFLYQGIFFHMVFKFALGGFFTYILLRKYFNVSKWFSIAGGYIYAFSGFSLFYLWFHFGDTIAFFPLFILGVERCLQKRKGDLLSIGLFMCGMSNYFFLVNYCIFGFFYCVFRWIYIYGFTKKRGYTIKERYSVLLLGVVHAALGVMMAGICLLPSLAVASSASRTEMSQNYLISVLSYLFQSPGKIDGKFVLSELKPLKEVFTWDNIKGLLHKIFIWDSSSFSSSEFNGSENVGYILSNWLFMNTNCWDSIMFNNESLDNSLGGFFITTPLTMLLVPSIINTVKTKRVWGILGLIVCLAVPFFPFTSHMAFGFTSLYGRWEIWIVLIGIVYIIPTLDHYELCNRRWVTLNLVINYALAAVVYFTSKKLGKLPTGDELSLFGHEIPAFIVLFFVELIVMFMMWFVYRMKFIPVKYAKKFALLVIVAEVGVSTVITTEEKGYSDWDSYIASTEAYEELGQVVDDIKANDNSFYRILNTEATRLQMNMPSALNYAGASSFNSTYDFNLDKFKNRSRMAYSGGWTMGDHEKRYWLDQYIGTKYYIIDKQDPNNDNYEYNKDRSTFFDGRTSKDEEQQTYALNLGWNYKKLDTDYTYYDVYENTDCIGIGCSVDNIIKDSTVGTGYYGTYYEELYATTAIVSDDDFDEIKTLNDSINQTSNYSVQYSTVNFSGKWDLYFSPREDADVNNRESGDYSTRNVYKLESDNFTKSEISSYLAENQQFFHKRWEETERFGDELILKLKDGYLFENATENNICYINLQLKLGPKILVSFYHDDELITQDAHMNCNSSLSKDAYEWKLQRGYYLNKPVNKIVLEFVSDTSYDKFFQSSNNELRALNITYCYQNKIKQMQGVINTHLIQDVTYGNNKFTFKTDSIGKRLYVTNIPYDDGWTLKKDGKEVKTYNVNGGFIGFIADDGVESYELTYYTPNLSKGIQCTVGGILIWIFICYIYADKDKKKKLLSAKMSLSR